jgi:ketosteroid isomerase-like protein
MDTRDVFEHHLAALGSGDVEEILKDYTEESVLLDPSGTFKGLAALRGFFDAAVAGLFKPGTYTFTMDVVRVVGEVAYCVWHASCAAAEIVLATDTFVVRDGKISTQTFAAKIEPK